MPHDGFMTQFWQVNNAMQFRFYNQGMAARPAKKQAPPFGQRLAALRKSRGLSQAAFAKLLQTTREVIDYYERRAVNPTLDFVQRAAAALDVSLTALLDQETTNSKEAKAQSSASKDSPTRRRPGPVPQLQLRFERIRRLPRKDQEFIIKFLDTFLDQAEKS